MSVGYPPKHNAQFQLSGLTQEQFLVLAVETAARLNWQINYISESGLVAFANYGATKWNAQVKIIVEGGVASLTSVSAVSEMMDGGKNRRNIENFLAALHELKTAFTDEELAEKFDGWRPHITPPEHDMLRLPPPPKSESFLDIFGLFKPSKSYFVTPILIDINLAIFFMMAITGAGIVDMNGASLLAWGANFKPLTTGGEWWRLLTCCFLHGGIVHLLMNMIALFFIGLLLEPHLGKLRYFLAYIITGIGGSLLSLWWHDRALSVGASGAIFGMYGVFIALLTTNLIAKRTRKIQFAFMVLYVGYSLLKGVSGNTDNAAHIGGLLSGLLIGYLVIPGLWRQKCIQTDEPNHEV